MKLKSRGLGRKELVMDFREYVVRREGDEIVIQGTIREPVHWDFAIRMCEDDLAGVARVALQRPTIALLLRALFKRDKSNHWSVDRKTQIEQANAARKEQVAKAAEDAAKAKESAEADKAKAQAKAQESAEADKDKAKAQPVGKPAATRPAGKPAAAPAAPGKADDAKPAAEKAADAPAKVTEISSRARPDQREQARKAREAIEARQKAKAEEAKAQATRLREAEAKEAEAKEAEAKAAKAQAAEAKAAEAEAAGSAAGDTPAPAAEGAEGARSTG